MESFKPQSYTKLGEAAQTLFSILNRFIGTNSFCISNITDQVHSQLIHVFHRNEVLFEEGAMLSLQDTY